MEVICLESQAFYTLVKKVVAELKQDENAASDFPEWVDGTEAMALLNISVSTLQRLRHSGQIEYTQPSRKYILYRRASILSYLEKHKRSTL